MAWAAGPNSFIPLQVVLLWERPISDPVNPQLAHGIGGYFLGLIFSLPQIAPQVSLPGLCLGTWGCGRSELNLAELSSLKLVGSTSMGWKSLLSMILFQRGQERAWGGREEELPAEKVAQAGALKEFPAEKVAQTGALKERKECISTERPELPGRG